MHGNSRKIDWVSMKMEYAHDATVTFHGLAKKYNIPCGTVRWHGCRDGWANARWQFQQKVEDKLTEAATSKDVVAKLREINDKQMRWNEEMRHVINSLLKCRNDEGVVVLREDINLNDVSRAIASMAELYRLDRLALGASTDNVQPAITRDRIDEMSDDEVMEELQRVRARVTIN
jgi:hypothetical protein